MKIQFLGAAREVTGSRHLLKVNGRQILLDCGMFQGNRKEARNKNEKPLADPSKIDAILLSHAHIDHSGAIPLFVKKGFHGPIYSTHATRDLCAYMLLDSGFIQEREAEYMKKRMLKKKHAGHGHEAVEPLYTADDAKNALDNFVSMNYDKPFEVVPGVMASFRDAGHILGSSMIVLVIDDQAEQSGAQASKASLSKNKKQVRAEQKILVFTGDLGRKGLPILRDPTVINRADILLMESTYGNRFHHSIDDIGKQLEKLVNDTAKRGGKIIIPAFAVERTQEIVYHLNNLFQQKRIPDIPIFVDSPLAVNLTDVFTAHPECFDKEIWQEFLKNRKNPFGFGRLKYITDAEDSKALNNMHGPAIIISAAGMCEFGRILHHLKNNIEDPRNTILIVGYMAKNTLGRQLLEKKPSVKIFGDTYRVRANVTVMDAFSAHADRSDLLDFVSHIKGLKKIFLVHGEEDQGLKFAGILKEEGYKGVSMPALGEEIDI